MIFWQRADLKALFNFHLNSRFLRYTGVIPLNCVFREKKKPLGTAAFLFNKTVLYYLPLMAIFF